MDPKPQGQRRGNSEWWALGERLLGGTSLFFSPSGSQPSFTLCTHASRGWRARASAVCNSGWVLTSPLWTKTSGVDCMVSFVANCLDREQTQPAASPGERNSSSSHSSGARPMQPLRCRAQSWLHFRSPRGQRSPCPRRTVRAHTAMGRAKGGVLAEGRGTRWGMGRGRDPSFRFLWSPHTL